MRSTNYFMNRVRTGAMLAMMLLLSISSYAQTTPTSTTPLAQDPKLVLTADQQKKLAKLRVEHGLDVALSLPVTAALGIGKSDEVQTLRELVVNTHPGIHGYIPLLDGGILFFFFDDFGAEVVCSYRVDAKQKLIAAVSKKSDQAPVVIPIPDADRNVQIELSFWASLADRH